MPELAYNYGNSKELAQKIDLALQDKKLRERVKKEFSKLTEETTWIKTAFKHQELYKILLSRQKPLGF
jgi:DNA-binding transcriptional regulator GbsR (MarR family)